MIQIRNVPDSLHRKLEAKAALEGISLSEYLLRELRALAEKPTLNELLERLAKREPVAPSPPPRATRTSTSLTAPASTRTSRAQPTRRPGALAVT